MAIYEYKCNKHGLFTAVASLANYDAPQNCPECDKPSPRNLLSAPQISTKGDRPKANNNKNCGRKVKHQRGCPCCT